MPLLLLFQGIIVGVSISASLGPIAVLVFQRSVARGYLAGMLSGFGAMTGDMLYAYVAAFGIGAIAGFVTDYEGIIGLIGALFLLALGVMLFLTRPEKKPGTASPLYLVIAFITTLFLSLTNPITIVMFSRVIATHPALQNSSEGALILFLLGILLGAVLWWFSFSYVVDHFRKKYFAPRLLYINKVTGGVIILFSIISAVSLFL